VAIVVTSVGKQLGNYIAFVISRVLGAAYIKSCLQTSSFALIRGLNLAMLSQPYKMCFLLRLVFIPISVKNYGMGLLPCTHTQFLVTSTVTGIPFSVLWCVAGHSMDELKEILNGSSGSRSTNRKMMEIGFLVLGAVSLAMSLAVVGYYSKKEWDKMKAQIDKDYGGEKKKSWRSEKKKSKVGEGNELGRGGSSTFKTAGEGTGNKKEYAVQEIILTIIPPTPESNPAILSPQLQVNQFSME